MTGWITGYQKIAVSRYGFINLEFQTHPPWLGFEVEKKKKAVKMVRYRVLVLVLDLASVSF